MQTLQPQKSIALIKMILSMAIFGSIGYFTQISGLPSIELVFVRCICATVLLAIVWGISGQAKKELWNGREVLLTLLCGFFLVFNWVFLFKA
ncbi:MAG: EamA family transporter, partial [Lysinibacillus sp.]